MTIEFVDNRPMSIGDRVRDLRKALGKTQAEMAERTDGVLDQSYWTKIESGKNRASTVRVRSALAKAFGISELDMNAYLADLVSLESTEALVIHGYGPALVARPTSHQTPDPTYEPDEQDPLELALFEAFDTRCYSPKIFDASRRAVIETARLMKPDGDILALARSVLEAAASLDRDAHPLTTSGIWARVATGKSPHAIQSAAEAESTLNERLDAENEARGVTREQQQANRQKLLDLAAKKLKRKGDG